MQKIAIFASGTGSNALKIIEHTMPLDDMEVTLIVTNRRKAGVRNIAKQHYIDDLLWRKEDLADQDLVLETLRGRGIEWIVLAGWLTLIPPYLVEAYRGRILNIHPALLPKYGGKGMYGHYVHEAVKQAGDKETGITIHHVNEAYDEGAIILQARTDVGAQDTVTDIAKKVQVLEHRYYPIVVEELVRHRQ